MDLRGADPQRERWRDGESGYRGSEGAREKGGEWDEGARARERKSEGEMKRGRKGERQGGREGGREDEAAVCVRPHLPDYYYLLLFGATSSDRLFFVVDSRTEKAEQVLPLFLSLSRSRSLSLSRSRSVSLSLSRSRSLSLWRLSPSFTKREARAVFFWAAFLPCLLLMLTEKKEKK